MWPTEAVVSICTALVGAAVVVGATLARLSGVRERVGMLERGGRDQGERLGKLETRMAVVEWVHRGRPTREAPIKNPVEESSEP